MKKLFGLIVVVAIGYGIWYLSNKAATSPIPLANAPVADSTNTNNHPDPSNATFTFEDGPFTLKKGMSSKPITPNSASTEETSLVSTIGYGDLNNDGKEDAVVTLMQSGAGTGTFIYAAAYVSGPVGYKGTNAVYIGDRIQPKSITVNKTEITFNYLDRKPDEPMDAEPTISAYKTILYSNGTLTIKN